MSNSLLNVVASTVLLLVVANAEPQPTKHFQLASAVKREKLASAIPRTDNELLESIRTDPRLLVYTKDEVPPVFQAADNGRLGVFAAGTTFTVGGVVVGGGSNQFPWRTPAGLGQATDWETFQFLWLPLGRAIEWGFQRLPRDRQSARSITWTYPVGTVLGEVLGLTNGGMVDPVPFELRVRRKIGEDSWRADIFRPFRTREELDLAVALTDSPQADAFVGVQRRSDWVFRQPLFSMIPKDAVKDMLPPLDRRTVRELLANTFTSVRDSEWVPGGFAPDVERGFHIVPPNYAGVFLSVTNGTCAACHRTAGKNVAEFGMPAPAGWDEWVRGNAADQSMTWHPFHPDSIATDGNFRPVNLRGDLIAAGLLKQRE